MQAQRRLLGIGDATVDIYLDEGMQYPGGNTVNVAVQATWAGAKASWLGCLGRDMLGELVRDSLVAEGVDVSHARMLDGPNPWSRVRHERGDRHFAGSNPGVRSRYDLTETDLAFVAEHDLVHTSVHSDLDAELSRIRATCRLLSYDYSEHWQRPGKTATFPHVDIAFLSAPRHNDTECQELLTWAVNQGAGMAVLTRGAAGACALQNGRLIVQHVHPVTIVDTLGAGDGFIAGFLIAHADGFALTDCLDRGAAQAARVCGIKGAYGHGAAIRPGQPGLDPSQIVNHPQSAAKRSATHHGA